MFSTMFKVREIEIELKFFYLDKPLETHHLIFERVQTYITSYRHKLNKAKQKQNKNKKIKTTTKRQTTVNVMKDIESIQP